MKKTTPFILIFLFSTTILFAENDKKNTSNQLKAQRFLKELNASENLKTDSIKMGFDLNKMNQWPHDKRVTTTIKTIQPEKFENANKKYGIPLVFPKTKHTMPVSVPDSTQHYHIEVVR